MILQLGLRRIDEPGADALVRLPQPVNQFPEFVGYVVRRLKTWCPALGKRKVAAILARAGLHLGSTTVGRMLQKSPSPRLSPVETVGEGRGEGVPPSVASRIVTAREPNHVWHVDLTVVPIAGGFWVPWSPLSLVQCWPFGWWLAVVADHYSRRVMGVATFGKQPTSAEVRAFLGRTMREASSKPKYIVCDRGGQFDNDGFRAWCKRHRIKPRYGAVGRQGSIAVVEHCILTIKLLLAALPLIPRRRESFRREIALLLDWYNEHRPHETLGGRTPNERYFKRFPANRNPRYEPRSNWPRGSPCARPWALVRGSPGAKLELQVGFLAGRRHLPIVRLRRVA